MASLLDTRRAQSELVEFGVAGAMTNANQVIVGRVIDYVSALGGSWEDAADAILLWPRPPWLRELIGTEMLQVPESGEV